MWEKQTLLEMMSKEDRDGEGSMTWFPSKSSIAHSEWYVEQKCEQVVWCHMSQYFKIQNKHASNII